MPMNCSAVRKTRGSCGSRASRPEEFRLQALPQPMLAVLAGAETFTDIAHFGRRSSPCFARASLAGALAGFRKDSAGQGMLQERARPPQPRRPHRFGVLPSGIWSEA
jgi:hypothetical protein